MSGKSLHSLLQSGDTPVVHELLRSESVVCLVLAMGQPLRGNLGRT